MVRDDPNLLYDSEEASKVDGVVGGSNPSYEIVSLLDGKLIMWSSVSCIPKKTKF